MIVRTTYPICDMCGGCMDRAYWKALQGPFLNITVFFCDVHYIQVVESLKKQRWRFNKI